MNAKAGEHRRLEPAVYGLRLVRWKTRMLQAFLSITRGFFRLHSTFARLYNAAASPASRLCSVGSLAIKRGRYKSRTGSTRTASPSRINSDQLGSSRIVSDHDKKHKIKWNWNFYLPVKGSDCRIPGPLWTAEISCSRGPAVTVE